ncbi:MAG: hypothetical protein JSS07_10100 [Proteobacteria bacterium]|nr:hypothetical protein [Pseudomonadota bacterium]
MMSIKINDALYQSYLARVYQEVQGVQAAYTTSEYEAFVKEEICVTYGELLYPSVKKIIYEMALDAQDVFLDLGSGIGKCALQIFMQANVNKVIAIEGVSLLHQQAVSVCEKVKSEFPLFWEAGRDLILDEGNFLHANWHNATTIYTCSTCFTQTLLVAIGNKINQFPQVRQVLSLRPLPTINIPLRKVFGVECSWDSALCFLYRN